MTSSLLADESIDLGYSVVRPHHFAFSITGKCISSAAAGGEPGAASLDMGACAAQSIACETSTGQAVLL